MTPEGGYFDDFSSFEEDMNQPESPADDPAVFKEGIDLMGVSIGGDIEIFGGFSQEKVPDASPNEVGDESMSVKAVKNFKRLFIYHCPVKWGVQFSG